MQHQHILFPDCSLQHGSRALSTAESYLPHLLCLPCCERDPRVDTFCAQKFIKQGFHQFERIGLLASMVIESSALVIVERELVDAETEHDQT